jgi:hypothetical protein
VVQVVASTLAEGEGERLGADGVAAVSAEAARLQQAANLVTARIAVMGT